MFEWTGRSGSSRHTSSYREESWFCMKVPVISIVDDDASVREATNGLVRSLGYHAATFGSAEDFLESEHIDDTSCLITDVQMPGLCGVELQSVLIARGTRLPMIFITAFPEDRIRRCVLEAGAFGFLSKPFEEAVLIEHLETALGAKLNHCTPFRWSQFLLNPRGAREFASSTRVKHLPARQCDCRRGGAADRARG